MGMNSFAPYTKECGVFIVQNVSPQIKTINIFNYPINYLDTRDLMAIPGVGEDEIRVSLLKGELNHKFRALDVELIECNIDLLQFNSCQLDQLAEWGITTGTQVGIDQLDGYVQSLLGSGGGGGGTTTQYLWREEIQLIGMKNASNRTFYTPDKFLNGVFTTGDNFHIHVKHNGKDLYEGIDYSIAESGGPGTGYDTIYIKSIVPNAHSLLFATYAIQHP